MKHVLQALREPYHRPTGARRGLPGGGCELATAIHDYIEIWHNTRRRDSTLNMLTQPNARTNTNNNASPPDSRPPTPRNPGQITVETSPDPISSPYG